MMAILPVCITWIGKPEIREGGIQLIEEVVRSDDPPVVRRSIQDRTKSEDDVVELLD
jgi:hypothetical protein